MPPLDTHSIVTYVGAAVMTAFVFVHPDGIHLDDIALAFGGMAVAQGGGNALTGLQRKLQGGSTAPEVIVSPAPVPA